MKETGVRSLPSQIKPPSYRRTSENQRGKGPLKREMEKQGGKYLGGRAQGGDRGAVSENAGRD